MSHVIVFSTDRIGRAMAGPGIRAWEIARTLAEDYAHTVTLALPHGTDLTHPSIQIHPYVPRTPYQFTQILSRADCVIGQGFVFSDHPEILQHEIPVAVDLYDPLILESLDLYAHSDLHAAQQQHQVYQKLTNQLLTRGDFFFCATARQRDYWLGALTAAGRINPAVARRVDRDLLELLGLVPSGIPNIPPTASPTPVLRDKHPAIPAQAFLLLWAGGLWDWFDPDIIIRTVANLRSTLPDLRLCFFAGARPNPDGPPFRTRTAENARKLAEELGVLNREVIFLDDWIDYEQRGAYLAEADVGVSAHRSGVETRLAFRTRMLDYIWAGLPVVASSGDSLSEELARSEAALIVAPNDQLGWEQAVERLYTDQTLRTDSCIRMKNFAGAYMWMQVVLPLARWCDAPSRTSLLSD